jgi:maltooligosyltrehalose synthase
MKKVTIIASVLFLSMSLTSCYDFNRTQNQLDAESHGKEILLEAESSKKAKIEEAKAVFESSKLNSQTKQIKTEAEAIARITQAKSEAEARIIEAESKAKANRIISESLGGSDNYLRYIMINGVNKASKVYVPTSSNLLLK